MIPGIRPPACAWLLAWLAGPGLAQDPPSPPDASRGEQVDRQEGAKQGENKGDQAERGSEGEARGEHADTPQERAEPDSGPTPVRDGDSGSPPPGPPAPEGSAPSRPVVTWPLGLEALDAHLQEIAARYPGVATLRSLGRSAAGHEIRSLALTDLATGLASSKPVLLVVDFQGAAQVGAEAAVELAWRTCERFASDDDLRALLGKTALVIAPVLDPDQRARSGSVPPEVLFDRNFPVGWEPETMRPGSGRIALSRPETLAAARFLSELESAAVVLGAAPRELGSGLYPGAELPGEDRQVLLDLCAALESPGYPAVFPWFEMGSPGGGFFDFAYQARGILPVVNAPPGEEELAQGVGSSAWLGGVAERALACLALLPRVEIVQEGLQRLAPELWQLDVRIGNPGVVPTLSALARRRAQGSDIRLELRGAKLVATASRPSGGAAYLDASFHDGDGAGGLPCGTLQGGETRWLRLILEAGSGARIELLARAMRAGSARLEVVLP